MAQEFGGKFSPGGQKPPSTTGTGAQKPIRVRAGIRAKLMFFAPLPLLFTGFGQINAGNPFGILRDFGAFVILILAAWLLREGLKAQAAFIARTHARKPAFPRKILAAVLVGIGVAMAAGNGIGSGLALTLVLGLLAGSLHLLAFGLDPLRSKGLTGYENFENRRVALAVEEAEDHITTMLDAMAGLKDRALKARLEEFATSARAMFRAVEQDPRDLSSARKYLGVYLMGARDATLKFVDLYATTHDADARHNYEALLADLEKNFDAQRKELLLDDHSDLDVEIEVLRSRLRHEGVST